METQETIPPVNTAGDHITAQAFQANPGGNNLIMQNDGTLIATANTTAAGQVSDSDRLLCFDSDGNPATVTPRQISVYTQSQTPYMGENLAMRSNAYPGVGQGFIQYALSEHLKRGENITITVEGETTGNAPFSMGFVTSDGQYQGDIWNSLFDGVKNVLTTVVPDYANDVTSITFYFMSPGISKPRIKLERGAKATPYIPNPADISQMLPYSLDEQIVPGEFWEEKQVYQRVFKQSTSVGHVVMYGVTDIVDAWGYVINPVTGNRDTLISKYFEFIDVYYVPNNESLNELRLFKAYNISTDFNYTITVKYTK